ncbi:MAG: hypothetical protein KC912_07810 [Proteobacteria bacterium]|nr:hypothetical protein [Pseudomonadota bacterium]
MDFVPVSWLVVSLTILVLALLGWWRASTRITRGNAGRQRRAQWGEDDAERLLIADGFTIVDRQVTGEWSYFLDGEPITVRCRADFLVSQDDHRFIAEVKTGERAIDPTNPSTRRQLLEYQLAFPVDGILLLDMESREVFEVYFDTDARGDFIYDMDEA